MFKMPVETLSGNPEKKTTYLILQGLGRKLTFFGLVSFRYQLRFRFRFRISKKMGTGQKFSLVKWGDKTGFDYF